MKVKRFTAANMQAALRLVSQELGADAVILSTKKVAQGIEVVAALDYSAQVSKHEIERQLQLQSETEAMRPVARPSVDSSARLQAARNADVSSHAGLVSALNNLKNGRTGAARPAPTRAPENKAPVVNLADKRQESGINTELYNHALQQVQGELRDLKDWMVSQKGSPWDTQRPMTWQQGQLWSRCNDLGLDTAWADSLTARVTATDLDAAWQQLLGMMQTDLPIEQTRLLDQGGMIALVGPTGAGKTTTIGKMAAQFVIRNGSKSVALVTLDNYRVAAHDQLRTFARILGVDFHVVPNNGDLNKVLDGLTDKKLVLVDSAGLASQDPHFSTQLSMLKKTGARVKKLLVLPLTSQSRCLQENYEIFKPAGLSGCVMTKLDECFCLGAAMSVAALTRLPINLVTDGPHIPDDIHYPDAAKLIKLAEQMARMARTRWQASIAMNESSRTAGVQHGV